MAIVITVIGDFANNFTAVVDPVRATRNKGASVRVRRNLQTGDLAIDPICWHPDGTAGFGATGDFATDDNGVGVDISERGTILACLDA